MTIRSLSLLMVLLSAGVAAAQAPAAPAGSPEAIVRSIEAARLGGELAAFTPKSPGHLRFSAPATAKQIVDGAGGHLGFLFGPTTLLYDIDPADEAVVHYNIGETWGLQKPAKGQPVRIEAKSVAWLTLDGPAPATAATTELPEVARRALDPKFTEPPVDFAAARMSRDTKSVWAVADLGDEKWLYYSVDHDLEEWLAVGRKFFFQQYPEWWLDGGNVRDFVMGLPDIETIDSRSIGRPRGYSTAFEPRAVDIKLVEEPGELGHAWATVEYEVLRDTGLLDLSLEYQGIDGATVERLRRVEGRVIAVADQNGAALPFASRRGSLLVELPKVARKGERLKLKFEYMVPLMRYGGDRNWLLLFGWYPYRGSIWQSWGSFHAEVRSLAPLTPVGSGRVVRRWTEGQHNCVELEEKRPSAGPVIGAGVYFPYEHSDAKGRQITVYSYAMERKHGQKKLAELFAGLVDVYERIYPPYPFSSLAIVEANSYGFGQAPTAYVRITQEAFNPLSDEITRIFSRYSNEIFSHETGHGWWGHYFRLASNDDEWFSESFAEYSSAWVLEVARKKGDMKRMANTWRAGTKDIRAPIPIVAANRLAGEHAGRLRGNLLYNKGPWVLHCLRSEIGDEAFFTAMRSFLRSFEGKRARTEDFLGLVNFITKKEWRPWFDKYVYGTEFPELKK